jgi:hypothetical protein
MDPAKYEYQRDFARRHVAQGRTEGRVVLAVRLRSRLAAASIDELGVVGEHLLAAGCLQGAMGSH